MMGKQPDYQHKLFMTGFNLDKRIRTDHPLRKIAATIDFDFIYHEVKDTYGVKGNVSVPPPVILKMMLLLILYNVRSERELMLTIPERLDWLYFLGYDLDSEIPHHSVLSKARARWGVHAFKHFFERIVWQCVEANLIDGSKLFADTSLIDANASNNSVVDTQSLKRYLKRGYRQLEKRLDDLQVPKTTPANSRYISTTDPDASVTRHSGGKSKLRYKTHRAVDQKREIITATKITPGSVDDGDVLTEMIETHKENTHKELDTVVADRRYGTIDTYLICHDLGIKAHIPSLEATQRGSGRQKGIFPKEAFTYHGATDTFTCPAGKILKRRHHYKKRNHYEYQASAGTCATCELRAQCTRSKTGRTVKQHLRQDELDTMLSDANSGQAKRNITTRQHLSERSFARSQRYGFKRARWRRLWRAQIQDFLIAAIQNIMVLVTQPQERLSKSNAQIGRSIRAQRAIWEGISLESLLRKPFIRLLWFRVDRLISIWLKNGFGQQPVAL
jgi:transposase